MYNEMKILIVINDAPYGTERAYNALRLAGQLKKTDENAEVRVFLMADAVGCAISNQTTPNGYYNVERMLKLLVRNGASVKLCGSYTDARGLRNASLVEGAEISDLAQLALWTIESDKVVVF